MQDLGTKLRMVVMAHRRISLLKKVEEKFDLPSPASTTTTQSDDAFVDMSNPLTSKASETSTADGVFVAETENLVHEPFETTDEIKALTQEVIKTIRDIIVRPVFKSCCVILKIPCFSSALRKAIPGVSG